MDADWDLQAVVRGCCSAVSSATTTATAPAWPVDVYTQQSSSLKGFFPDLFQPRSDNSIEQFLTDLYNPTHFPPPSSQSLPISPLSVLGGLQDPHYYQQQQPKQPLGISRCTTSHAPKFKKRKNQIKKVCQVPAEGSSSDLWSWRKYGQKPIKGSPYPRGYYKCSTSKGCLARKQVERNRSDPGMLIITYTGEHSHPVPTQRNSLARNKLTTSTSSGDDNRPTPPLSPATEKMDENDTDDDNNLETIFDELVVDSFSDHHATSKTAPWLSNSVASTTTAAAGGS